MLVQFMHGTNFFGALKVCQLCFRGMCFIQYEFPTNVFSDLHQNKCAKRKCLIARNQFNDSNQPSFEINFCM